MDESAGQVKILGQVVRGGGRWRDRVHGDQIDARRHDAEAGGLIAVHDHDRLEPVLRRRRDAVLVIDVVGGERVAVAEANVQAAIAQLSAAKLNVGYTVVTAPIDGQLSSVDLQPGQFVSPGQSLFYLVNTKDKWVVANFKETQLQDLKIGQKVMIEVDAFPGEEFHAEVTAFSPATGARFSLLPPDNATGNFVKTIQRLPVKIDFTKENTPEKIAKLRSGMNVLVDVQLK